MENLESSEAGPIPESLRSWGVLKAPPDKITSRRAKYWVLGGSEVEEGSCLGSAR